MDPVTGFQIDPVTGWLIHTPTGYLIEPGTGNLVVPGSFAYSMFRWNPLTGLVEDVPADEESPEATASASPTASQRPTTAATARATTKPSPSAPEPSSSATPAGARETEQVSSQYTVGTHPLTRILVILLLVGLGVLYYARLRPGRQTPR